MIDHSWEADTCAIHEELCSNSVSKRQQLAYAYSFEGFEGSMHKKHTKHEGLRGYQPFLDTIKDRNSLRGIS